MAKKKRRAVPADLWLDRATDAQIKKMRDALRVKEFKDTTKELVSRMDSVMVPANAETREVVGESHMIPLLDMSRPEGERAGAWAQEDINSDAAYVVQAVIPTVSQGVPSYRLLKLKIERGQVVAVDAGVENLRETVLQDIEDHILRDA